LNGFPILEKMFQGILFQGKPGFILALNARSKANGLLFT